MKNDYNIWWGPPKKFTTQVAVRRISWLELFYDLVYVIVISRITGYLAKHADWWGLFDYVYLFAMTFWGWYNGSMHHDLHGSPGIRTRFMTLWQMMAAGALAVTLDSPPDRMLERTTAAILFLQLFITYLWWSVGIYDKEHRALNRPYTVWFLCAFALLAATFWIPLPYKRGVFLVVLVINYLPYALTAFRLSRRKVEFSLSSSMTERLGLFTIIIFGEAILGVINSVSHLDELGPDLWVFFGLGILVIFALWWIFFSTIADRECKQGMWAGNVVSFLYIPMLASLGMAGASFPSLLKNMANGAPLFTSPLQIVFGVSVALFLCCITAVSRYLEHPPEYDNSKKFVQRLLIAIAGGNVLLVLLFPLLSPLIYLLLVFTSLMIIIVVMTRSWFKVELRKLSDAKE